MIVYQKEGVKLIVYQKEVITVESYNQELNQHNKSEYVIISRNEYNNLTKQLLACKIVYSNNIRPYLVPIKVNGLRSNSKVDTLNICTLKHRSDSYSKHKYINGISSTEFLMIAQAVSLNFNFPL